MNFTKTEKPIIGTFARPLTTFFMMPGNSVITETLETIFTKQKCKQQQPRSNSGISNRGKTAAKAASLHRQASCGQATAAKLAERRARRAPIHTEAANQHRGDGEEHKQRQDGGEEHKQCQDGGEELNEHRGRNSRSQGVKSIKCKAPSAERRAMAKYKIATQYGIPVKRAIWRVVGRVKATD